MYIKHVHLFPLRIVLSVLQCEQGSWEHLFIFGIYSLTRSTTSLWPCLSASYGGDCKALGDTGEHIYCHEDFEVSYKAQRSVYFYLFISFFSHLQTVNLLTVKLLPFSCKRLMWYCCGRHGHPGF